MGDVGMHSAAGLGMQPYGEERDCYATQRQFRPLDINTDDRENAI